MLKDWREKNMNIQKLHELHVARPFRPFLIHMADGRKIAVEHPEFLASAPTSDVAILLKADGGHEYIDIPLVLSLKITPHKSAGHAKR